MGETIAMISAAQNERLTRVGPGTPVGELLRRYWQPAALVDELAGDRPIKAVRLLGQELVLFRDEQGRYGLLDRHCPHRGADLSFGRLEDCGLRCPFHGWLFDVAGTCKETPAEPEGSTLYQRMRQRSYPVTVRSGILFAYLGNGEPPAFPEFDCFIAPDTHTFAFKGFIDCNWLQALEVALDPTHASFLHRFAEDEDPKDSYGKPFRGTSDNSELPITKVLREYPRPRIETESTDYGLRITSLRRIDQARTHVRVTNLTFPNSFVIPMDDLMTITQWQVPVDDTANYWYAIFTSFGQPVNKEEMREQRLKLYALPDYKPRRNRSNDWGFDPEEQRRQTYTGMGFDINAHDQWAVESQGYIQDRTREHLGESDKAIVHYRRTLARALEQQEKGENTLMQQLDPEQATRLRGPVAIDGISTNTEPVTYYQETDARRRRGSSWAIKKPASVAAE
jgi:phenylpropionate dioxygenase-like ring-hydroxylating dioxygenase large terminal subunit